MMDALCVQIWLCVQLAIQALWVLTSTVWEHAAHVLLTALSVRKLDLENAIPVNFLNIFSIQVDCAKVVTQYQTVVFVREQDASTVRAAMVWMGPLANRVAHTAYRATIMLENAIRIIAWVPTHSILLLDNVHCDWWRRIACCQSVKRFHEPYLRT